ncbi:TniQ family protein [Streptomyces yunnanensis]|uniref:Regulatory helix-turn-helix protein, lysR family n=1 Tax=Streptomyces yunnanensis TaxID=156453 RepID=A0A9X8QRD3_9ACTN|nr:TniQ family protein [Streptomyces yunnanensis]SHL54900.1 regulatory helix-turn-helix protein, lysR family [Streptomyces yunnanensis]
MSRPALRTFSIRVMPLPGEALDSWFEAMAHRLHTPMGELLPQLGLARHAGARRKKEPGVDIPSDWVRLLRPAEVNDIAHTCGIDPEQVIATTLAYYDHRALLLDHRTRQVRRWVLWGRGSGSRYCPDCLTAAGGRWQLEWRLGWSFACLRHHRLLADTCPHCGSLQRSSPHPVAGIPQPGHCANPATDRPTGPGSPRCGADLSQTLTLTLPHEHPALVAQRIVSETITSGTADFGIYERSAVRSLNALADLRAVASRALAASRSDILATLVPADVLDVRDSTGSPRSGPRSLTNPTVRPGIMAPPTAASTAAGVIAALHILGGQHVQLAGAELRRFTGHHPKSTTPATPTTMTAWGKYTSPRLLAVQLASIGPDLRCTDQLRYRTASNRPRYPDSVQDSHRRLHSIPGAFWPALSLRIAPPAGHYQRILRPALSCMLGLTGSRLDMEEISRRLGGATSGLAASRVMQYLRRTPWWTALQNVMTLLADQLDAEPAPLDYERRRHLDYSSLLPPQEWEDICRRTGQFRGRERRIHAARGHLFERISGLPAELMPSETAVTEADTRKWVSEFTTQLTSDLATELDHTARAFLDRHRIHDEPLTWQPDTQFLTGLELPGTDLDGASVAALHELIRRPRMTVTQAAHLLGTSNDAVKHLLAEHPRPPAPVTPGKVWATGHISAVARTQLPGPELRRLYIDERLSIRGISQATGISVRMITALAREYDIVLRPTGRTTRAEPITKEWLQEQYTVRRRPLVDLARETGMSPTSMARWARHHQIPTRRGGAGHNPALRALANGMAAPQLLRPALHRRGGREHLLNFAAAASYPTLGVAAQALKIKQFTLIGQVNRLERDLGGPLLERAARGRPMRLTPLGKKVKRAISRTGWSRGK